MLTKLAEKFTYYDGHLIDLEKISYVGKVSTMTINSNILYQFKVVVDCSEVLFRYKHEVEASDLRQQIIKSLGFEEIKNADHKSAFWDSDIKNDYT